MGRDAQGRFTSGGDGLEIPVSTPGGDEAVATFTRVADALDKTGKKAEEAAAKTSRWDDAVKRVKDHAQAFNEVRAGVSAVLTVVTQLAEGVANLSAEQSHLDDMSRRLGLDFDEAAGAAGRFTDEVDVMNTAGAFAARGIRLTQDELNAMTRAAARNAQMTGVETSQALGTLEEALVRGRARGLAPFGEALAATAAHGYTLREGLAALVAQEGSTASATDDARTAAQGLGDAFGDGARALATMASNALGLPDMISAITRGVSDLVGQLNEVNRLAAQARHTGQQVDQRQPALAEFATVQRQITEVANRAGMSEADRRRLLALPNINHLTPEQIREVSGRLSVAAHHANDNAQASPDSIANAFRAGTGGTFGTSAQHSENELDAMARSVARIPSPAEMRRALVRTLAETRRMAEQAIAENERAAPSDASARNRHVSEDGGASSAAARALQQAQREMASASADKARDYADRERQAAEQRRHDAEQMAFAAAQKGRDQAANDNETARQSASSVGAKANQNEEYAARNSTRIRSFFAEQANAAVDLRKTVEDAYGGMTSAASAHFEALVTGQETAGAALQGFVHDTLAAWAKIAAQQALIELGAGFASIFTNPAAAPAHFIAAGLYGVAAAATGGLAAATAPAAAGGGGSGGSQRAASVGPQRSDGGGGGGMTIVQNYYAPTFGGREGTEAEIGVRLNRYDDAARARLRRAA